MYLEQEISFDIYYIGPDSFGPSKLGFVDFFYIKVEKEISYQSSQNKFGNNSHWSTCNNYADSNPLHSGPES